jgi:LemA protein
MEAGYSEEKFKQHIKTVVANAEGENTFEERPLTLGELKELAISMGMSEEEWDALQEKAHVHLASAQDHLKARNFDEAIVEAEKATSINPYLPNGNSVLAKTYQMLWLEDQNTTARDKAEYHARRELVVDPKDRDAIQILSTINKKRKLSNKESDHKRKYLLYGGIAALLLIVLYFSFSSGSSAEENAIIEAQENMYAKYDLVQTAIDQRNNMLPDLFSAVGQGNQELSELKSELKTLTSELKNASKNERYKLEEEIDEKLKKARNIVLDIGEQDKTEAILVDIAGAENRIAYEKKVYNDAVKKYNILVKKNKGSYPQYDLQPYYNEQ